MLLSDQTIRIAFTVFETLRPTPAWRRWKDGNVDMMSELPVGKWKIIAQYDQSFLVCGDKDPIDKSTTFYYIHNKYQDQLLKKRQKEQDINLKEVEG